MPVIDRDRPLKGGHGRTWLQPRRAFKLDQQPEDQMRKLAGAEPAEEPDEEDKEPES